MKKFMGAILFLILMISAFVYSSRIFYNNDGRIHVYLDGKEDKEFGHVLLNNNIYISANYLLNNNLLDFYFDIDYHKISIFNSYNYEVINYNKKKAFYKKNGYNREDVFIIQNGKLYFNNEFLKDNYIDGLYVDNNNLNVIIEQTVKEYEIVKDTKLRSQPSYFSKVLQSMDYGRRIYVYGCEYEGCILARTQDNSIGYVKVEDVKPISNITYTSYRALNNGNKIKMAWDLISSPIEQFEEFSMPECIDIIAPTWYRLTDDNNLFYDLSNEEYIKYVKKSNKDICGVFSNSFDPDLTNKLLNDGIKRSRIVDRTIDIAEIKKFDIINIDFENIYLKDKDVFSAFIKELFCKAKSKGLTLSVDITVLSHSENWSLFYDRGVIGKYSDFIMLMAYDENVSGTPGSVSSLPWVEYGIQNLLKDSASQKIVLCIPFYTRLWEKNDEKIKSTALKIQTAKHTIDEIGIELSYDKSSRQNYGEKTVEGITYMIWNEDETSLLNRIELADKYKLAGLAVWALDYGTEDMWNIIKIKSDS